VDQEGNVFVADTCNGTIRKISREGAVSTLAGSAEGESGHVDGAGDTARFDAPVGLAVDTDGTIVVADNDNESIRKVTPEGVVSTLAGPTASERGNPRSSRTAVANGYADGPANTARFNDLFAVAIDADGNVLVADLDAVRMITHTGLSRGVAVPRWPVGKPALAANLLALLDDERFADVSFGAQALRALHALTLRNRRACGTYTIRAPLLAPLARSLARPLADAL
jgi:DNA-binding beta-propeller fold protein YncE